MKFPFLLGAALFLSSICVAAPAENHPIIFWPTERGLEAPVSLEAAHLKVSDLVTEVATQTKININLPSQLMARSLAMRADKMPLSQLLPALAQLYGLEWVRDTAPASFTARIVATPSELAYLQLGNFNEMLDRVSVAAQQSERQTLDFTKGWDESRLTAGVALSELPPSLRQELQGAKRQRVALNYLGDWGESAPFALRSMRVRVVLPRADKTGVQGAPQFALVDEGGNTRRLLGAMELSPAK